MPCKLREKNVNFRGWRWQLLRVVVNVHRRASFRINVIQHRGAPAIGVCLMPSFGAICVTAYGPIASAIRPSANVRFWCGWGGHSSSSGTSRHSPWPVCTSRHHCCRTRWPTSLSIQRSCVVASSVMGFLSCLRVLREPLPMQRYSFRASIQHLHQTAVPAAHPLVP